MALELRFENNAAHSGHEVVLISNQAAAELEMQRLDDSQDLPVVIIEIDNDSQDANCWCYGDCKHCEGMADGQRLDISARLHCTGDPEINHDIGDSISGISSEHRKPLA